jgi:hypothetical protein
MARCDSYQEERREAMRKSGVSAFFLGFIPGMGHLYLSKMVRGIMYPIVFVCPLIISFLVAVGNSDAEYLLIGSAISFVVWVITMLDLVITINIYVRNHSSSVDTTSTGEAMSIPSDANSTKTIMLSLIPGLGHMHLSLMQASSFSLVLCQSSGYIAYSMPFSFFTGKIVVSN